MKPGFELKYTRRQVLQNFITNLFAFLRKETITEKVYLTLTPRYHTNLIHYSIIKCPGIPLGQFQVSNKRTRMYNSHISEELERQFQATEGARRVEWKSSNRSSYFILVNRNINTKREPTKK